MDLLLFFALAEVTVSADVTQPILTVTLDFDVPAVRASIITNVIVLYSQYVYTSDIMLQMTWVTVKACPVVARRKTVPPTNTPAQPQHDLGL